jgi:hypothetical protein
MKRAGDVLSALFDESFMRQAGGYSALFSCWKDLTKKNGIAAAGDHSWIKSIEKGIVWLEVDHPGWKQILQTKESKLLSDFQRRFPSMDISGISIALSRPVYTVLQEASGTFFPVKEMPHETPFSAKIQNPGYSAIKSGQLKESLMRLEKHIVEKDSKK